MLFKKNYHSYRNGVINLVLLLLIIFALLAFAAWLGYNIGVNAAEGLPDSLKTAEIIGAGGKAEIYLTAISLAENVQLSQASGIARINAEQGRAEIDVILPEGKSLPQGATIEAWLVDAGKEGGLGSTSVSAADERYGTPFANVDFSDKINSAPFAHSLGQLQWRQERGSFYKFTSSNNGFLPYDAVMITLEADGNQGNYDPRPGTPILIGEIK